MIVRKKDLTKLSTIRTKSLCNYYTEIDTLSDIFDIYSFAMSNNLTIEIIGKGTNILFTKSEYMDKLFIKLGKEFNYFKIDDKYCEIGASYSFSRAGKKLINAGYRDFIYMYIIPGSLGGAIRQNAGTTNYGEVKDNFESARLFDIKTKKIVIFNKNDMKFSYRNSLLQIEKNRYIVLSAKFKLGNRVKDIDNLKVYAKEIKNKKIQKEPLGYSFGSTFKSIKYLKPVWWYIEQVGLRGKIVGGAKFSEKHANWIINFNNATSNDILSLINEAKEKVFNRFKIDLQIEVELI